MPSTLMRKSLVLEENVPAPFENAAMPRVLKLIASPAVLVKVIDPVRSLVFRFVQVGVALVDVFCSSTNVSLSVMRTRQPLLVLMLCARAR